MITLAALFALAAARADQPARLSPLQNPYLRSYSLSGAPPPGSTPATKVYRLRQPKRDPAAVAKARQLVEQDRQKLAADLANPATSSGELAVDQALLDIHQHALQEMR